MRTLNKLLTFILTFAMAFSMTCMFTLVDPAEVRAEETLNINTINVGDHIYIGEATTTYDDAYWRVLDVDENNKCALMLSEYIWLTQIKYDNDGNVNEGQSQISDWQGSDAQAWCQNFYGTNLKYSPLVKGMNVEETETVKYGNYTYQPCSLTVSDKVFFLSVLEIDKYFNPNESGVSTDLKAYVKGDTTARYQWWLRSSVGSDSVAYVQPYGAVKYTGVKPGAYITDYSNTATFYVRPAFYLDLSSDINAAKDGNDNWVIDDYEGEPEEDIPEAQNYSVTGTVNTTGSIEFEFDETDFANSSDIYNHTMGRAAAAFSLLAYESTTDNLENVLVNQLGFGNVHTWNENMEDDTGLYSPYMIAHKKVMLNGEKTELAVVVIRGTYHEEWLDDFDSGTGSSEGSTHEGFDRATKFILDDISEYLNDPDNGFDNSAKMKILVTGHSRGAAVANLIGKYLDAGGLNDKLADDDIFVYTFATPNTAVVKDSEKESYNNIFNIVNPEDFVTKVIPRAWGYSRYGITYILPSKTTDSWSSYTWGENNHFVDYSGYLAGLKAGYRKLGSDEEYVSYTNGERELANYVTDVVRAVDSINAYYYKNLFTGITKTKDLDEPSVYSLHDLYKYALGGFKSEDDSYKELSYGYMGSGFVGTYGGIGIETINFFIENATQIFIHNDFLNINIDTKKRFNCAHMAETYYSAMDILSKEELTQERHVLVGEAHCPVDIAIKDTDGNIVGQIINNEVNESVDIENTGILMAVEGDSKQFSVPKSTNYTIEITGNGTGTMDYSLREVDADSGEIQRIYYQEVPITTSTTLTETLKGATELTDIKLVDNEGKEIEPDAVLDNGGIGNLSIEVTVEGIGSASSLYNLNPGDYATLQAVTDEYNEFLGWYDSEGKLLSEDPEYGISMRDNVTLTAKFTENEEPGDPELAHVHTFSEWTTTVPATEVSTGVQIHTCTICGASETQVISELAPTLPAVKISKPKSAKKKITVKWKKVSKKNLKKIKKVQIQISTTKDFSSEVKTFTAGAKKTSKKVSGLKKGTTYYIRVRALNGSHCSAWSSVKTAKAK